MSELFLGAGEKTIFNSNNENIIYIAANIEGISCVDISSIKNNFLYIKINDLLI